MAIGNEDVIRILNNVKAPYNVSKLASNAAHTAFQHLDVLEKNVEAILKVGPPFSLSLSEAHSIRLTSALLYAACAICRRKNVSSRLSGLSLTSRRSTTLIPTSSSSRWGRGL